MLIDYRAILLLILQAYTGDCHEKRVGFRSFKPQCVTSDALLNGRPQHCVISLLDSCVPLLYQYLRNRQQVAHVDVRYSGNFSLLWVRFSAKLTRHTTLWDGKKYFMVCASTTGKETSTPVVFCEHLTRWACTFIITSS